MEALLDYAELYFLLKVVGADAPVGMDAASFSPPEDEESEKVLRAGQSSLMARDEEGGRVLVEALADPTVALHATRVQQNRPDEHIWFFHAPSQTVRLKRLEQGEFHLSTLAGEVAVLGEVEQFLPLSPVPEDLVYRVRLPYEDFLALRDLATEWKEVPALDILEAEGLDEVSSRDLFDSAVEPEWRAIIDCLTCRDRTVAKKSTVRVLEGAEISWIIRPAGDDRLIVETSRPGLFNKALADMWASCRDG